MKNFDLVIVGVGGQGTLLASKILGHLALSEGCGVKVSEVHGMSQRGGSVVTYVRYGEKVYSPIIDKGEADYIISFEKLYHNPKTYSSRYNSMSTRYFLFDSCRLYEIL